MSNTNQDIESLVQVGQLRDNNISESSDQVRHALTIVIPTYNEIENLPKMLETLFGLGLNELQVLLVDDNSPDGTGSLAEQLGREQYDGRVEVLHRIGKLGLGTAYVEGFRYALAHGAKYVVHMDADFSHDPAVIRQFLELIKEADVAVGSRYTKGGSVDRHWSLFRKLLSRSASVYTRLVLGLKVSDTTAGFKLFRAEALAGLPLEQINCNGYAFHIAVAYLSEQCHLRIVETPIYFRDRTLGKSKMSLQIMFEAAWRVWQLKFRLR